MYKSREIPELYCDEDTVDQRGTFKSVEKNYPVFDWLEKC